MTFVMGGVPHWLPALIEFQLSYSRSWKMMLWKVLHSICNMQYAGSRQQRNQRSSCQHLLDHRKSKKVPEKHLLLLYWLYQNLWLCGSQQTVENLKEMGIRDHLTCLPRNLYAGQEATVRTGHETTDCFQIVKEVHQGCILSLCLFNLYAKYIMQNAGLDEAQAGYCWEKYQ